MPIYEFDCADCRRRFEVLIPIGREAEVACPECRSRRVFKRVTAFGIRAGAGRSSSTGNCTTCRSSSCSGCK